MTAHGAEEHPDVRALRVAVAASTGVAGPTRMLPAVAYTSEAVLAWERRHLLAGSWTCLGRSAELLGAAAGVPGARGEPGRPVTQRAVRVGDVAALLAADPDGRPRLFANTCRHRGHELLADGETSDRRSVVCPYHAWTYTLAGALQAAPGFRAVDGFDATEHGLVELPLAAWGGWLFGHGLAPVGSPDVPDFAAHLGDMARLLDGYRIETLQLADRHTYEVAANWKVIAENYHECYHCPLIHPELCQVSPPDSGDNHDLPGAFVGGSMDLRDGTASMTLTGEAAAPPLPGVDPRRVEYLHLLPDLLVSAHPDYVMAHRLVPLSPDRTWIECSWYALADPDDGDPTRARRRVLGCHEPPGLGGVRVRPAWSCLTALPPRPLRAQRGRRRDARAHPRRGLPDGSAGPLTGSCGRRRARARPGPRPRCVRPGTRPASRAPRRCRPVGRR